MRKNSRLMTGTALALSVGMLFTGCANKNDTVQPEESSILVDVMQAENGTLTLTNQFVGTVAPKESVYVIPMAQGTVTNTYFEVGDAVKAGDILFEIDDTAAKMQLEQAQLTYNNTKLQVDSSWDSANTQQDSAVDQLETQKTAALGQLQAAQVQYFQLQDAASQAEDALEQAKQSGAATDDQIKYLDRAFSQAKMAVNAAETSLDAAQKSYDLVVESLEEAKTTDLGDTKKQLDTNLQLAKLGVDSAKLALSYYDVEAPISGTIISKGVEVNGFAAASQPAYVIANDETMSVTFFVSEAVKNTLSVGTELVLERNGAEYEGTITEVGNAVNQQTGLFQIKGTVYADGVSLPSGVSVKLFVETYKAENTIIIPYDAVYYESDGAYVYVAKDGKAVKTIVATGIFDDKNIEITGGIQLEDMIITSWSPRLIDGADVKTNAFDEAAN